MRHAGRNRAGFYAEVVDKTHCRFCVSVTVHNCQLEDIPVCIRHRAAVFHLWNFNQSVCKQSAVRGLYNVYSASHTWDFE